MNIPPPYTLNKNIVILLQQIERLKTEFDLFPQDILLEKYTRRKSILKSAVYSARIEGNPKTLEEVSTQSIKNSKEKHKRELWNLVRTLEFVLKHSWKKDVSIDDIKNLNAMVLNDLSPEAGILRGEPSAIFNQAGIAIYVCPPPQEIKDLLNQLLHYVNEDNEPFAPVKAALTHHAFEKIHPFLDGNGRVGRLLIHLLLKKWKFDLRGLVAFEEYFDQERTAYYDLLAMRKNDITFFVEFFLQSLKVSFKDAVKAQARPGKTNKEELLPPRRYEILRIIKDHRQVSFDFVRRRFMAVSDRLLRYDFKKLQDAEFIKKRGVTKGAIYEPKE